MIVRSYALFLPDSTYSGLWVSDDYAQTWSNVNATGLSYNPGTLTLCIDPYNSYNLVVTSGTEVFRSTNGGNSFTISVGAGATTPWKASQFKDSLNVILTGSSVALSSNGGLTFTNTGFDTVTAYGTSIVDPSFLISRAVTFENLAIGYMSIYDKLYKSTDGGYSWVVLNSDLPIEADFPITGLSSYGEYVTAINGNGIYHSSDGGFSFSLVSGPFPGGTGTDDNTLHKVGGINGGVAIYAAAQNGVGGDIFKSVNYGATWSLVGTVPVTPVFDCLFAYTSSSLFVIAGSTPADIYVSDDSFSTSAITLSTTQRTQASDSGYPYTCGQCPNPKFTYNEATGNCEKTETYGPLCEEGYYYSSVAGKCINIEDPIITYSVSGCPPGCSKTQGDDLRGYCNCLETASFIHCCFQIKNCLDEEDTVITSTDLSDYMIAGNIIKVEGSSNCWTISQLEDVYCDDAPGVIVTDVYADCEECLPKYFELTNCETESVIYAEYSVDLNISADQVVQILVDGIPTCYSVLLQLGAPPEEPIPVTVYKGQFSDCTCCLPTPAPEPEPFVRTTQKPVKNFYHITDSDCDIRTNVKFANNYYKLFRTIKNGLENPCGPVDFDKLWIEKELSDYSRINPPNQCVPIPTPVVPEECPTTPTVACAAPEDVSGSGNIN